MNPTPALPRLTADPLRCERDAVHDAVSAYCQAQARLKDSAPGQPGTIPPSGKVIGEPEIQAIVQAALDGWLTTGRFNRAFESRLADFVGVAHALTVNSGSSANLVALSSLFSPKLGKSAIAMGDEIITVAAGFPTTVNPIIQNNAIPVFVDIDIGTYNVDATKLDAALSAKTRAVMLAHTLGNPFNLDAVVEFCAQHNLWLIEDCCDALGSCYTPQRGGGLWRARTPTAADPALWTADPETRTPTARHVGTFGHLATLSFYPAHQITMGEGGAVLTAFDDLRSIASSIRDWGRDCWCDPGCDNTCGKRFDWQLGQLPPGYDHKYTYSHLGYNLKITDMQAACGLAQLERLPGFIEQRRKNFAHLQNRLSELSEWLILPRATTGSHPCWFGYAVTLRDACDFRRVDLLTWLDQHGIGTRLLFAGNLCRQPYFQDLPHRKASELKNADLAMTHTFWLGVWPGLREPQLDHVCRQIETFFGKHFD